MKHDRATEELREVASLYALGSLTQQEARSFEAHIKEGCSVCAAESRRFERAVAGIGFAVEELAAPEYVRDLLVSRIEREIQTPLSKAQAPPPLEEKTMQEFFRPSLEAPRLLVPPRRDRPSIFPWILVVLLVFLGVAVVYGWRSARELNVQLRAKASAAQSDVQDLQSKLGDTAQNSETLQDIINAMGKPGTKTAHLVVQTPSPASSAIVIWDTEKSECLVLGYFPSVPEGKRYQLWLFTPASKVSAGPLKISSKGFTTIRVPHDAVNASAAVVTLEPDSGSQVPTSPYYAVGRID